MFFLLQLKYAQPITAPPHQTYTSTIGSGNTQGPSTTHVSHAAPTTYQPMPHHSLQASSGQVAGETLTQGVSGANPSYTPAVQHQTQPSFKTTVYGKQREENPKSGNFKIKCTCSHLELCMFVMFSNYISRRSAMYFV